MHRPCYWINLEKSSSRRSRMESEFKQAGVTNHSRIAAVCPPMLHDYTVKIPSNLRKDHITPEEYCCTLSHIQAIFAAWQAGDDAALILEDDVRIIRWPGTMWDEIISSAPEGWQILHMLPLGDLAVSLLEDKKTPLWVPWRSGLWGTAAYIINRQGMQQVLSTYVPNYQNLSTITQVDFSRMSTKESRSRCVADWVLFVAAVTWSCTDVFFSEMGDDSTIKQGDLPMHQPTLQAIREVQTRNLWKLNKKSQ